MSPYRTNMKKEKEKGKSEPYFDHLRMLKILFSLNVASWCVVIVITIIPILNTRTARLDCIEATSAAPIKPILKASSPEPLRCITAWTRDPFPPEGTGEAKYPDWKAKHPNCATSPESP